MRRAIRVKRHCPSGKVRYRTMGDANIALSSSQQSISDQRREIRYYRCTIPECGGGWHLTSMPAEQSA